MTLFDCKKLPKQYGRRHDHHASTSTSSSARSSSMGYRLAYVVGDYPTSFDNGAAGVRPRLEASRRAAVDLQAAYNAVTLDEWAERGLIREGGASVCHRHGYIVAGKKPASVWKAVATARATPPAQLSPDGAELTILEKYLALPAKCPKCK